MRGITSRNLTAGCAALAAFATASQLKAAEAHLRVVDVGNAMCVVASVPGGHFMLFDAGDARSTQCAAAVQQIVGTQTIDLLVLSHSDADHIGELPTILQNHTVRRLVYTGHEGTSATTWPLVRTAITNLEDSHHGTVRNLGDDPLPNTIEPKPGHPRAAPLVVPVGNATATFVAGWHDWPFPGDAGHQPDESELRNVISIVVRFEFGGQSVLLTGDTIGRRRDDDDPEACRDAERWMVREGNATINSDVLVGQHHGGDNSSSTCFIQAVSPTFVVFPAGHSQNRHPRQTTADRFLDQDVGNLTANHILRTDRGDDDAGDLEWDEGLEPGCVDPRGDDDVEIILSDAPGSTPRVEYRQARVPCP
jgi:competence protein ComEC